MKPTALLLAAALFASSAAAAGSQAARDAIARSLLIAFNSGKYDDLSKHFTDRLKTAVTPEVFGRVKEATAEKLGPFRSVSGIRHTKSDEGFPVVELVASYEKSSAMLRVVFDSDERVAALALNPIAPPRPADPRLEPLARQFLNDFSEGHFEAAAANFTPSMHEQLPQARLRQLAQRMAETYGQFQSVSAMHYAANDEFRDIELTAVYTNALVNVKVVFDKQNRIAGVTFGKKK